MANELEKSPADESEQGQSYFIAKPCVSCIKPSSIESTGFQRDQHDGDIGSERGLSSPEPPVRNNKCRKGQKRRKTKGAPTFLLDCLANILLDGTRFVGDDTLGGYSDTLKDFLINLQLFLRTIIATEDAFPKSTDFERIIRQLFEDKAQEALERKSE